MHQISTIKGKGFVAKNFKKTLAFLKKNNTIVYAAGISNSKTKNKSHLKREFNEIKNFKNHINNKMLVYISTCSVSDDSRNKSLYVKNKIKIEYFIKKNFKKFIILRLPELVGKSKNPNTLMNFFFNKIKNKKKIKIFSGVERNLLDIDDAVKISKFIIKNKKNYNRTFNIMNKYFYNPEKIVKVFEKTLKIKANYVIIKKKKKKWKMNYKQIHKITDQAKINFDKNYCKKIIKKYY